MSRFAKASRKSAKARIALAGPSGSGKTATALRIARGLVGPTGTIAVIDTECGSAELYAGSYGGEFCACALAPPYTPASFVEALRDAAQERFDAVIIDSLSHAWAGDGGALAMVDAAAKRAKSANTYTAWRDVTPEHQRLVDAIVRYPGHVIATMRSKTEYVMQTGQNGKSVPTRVGMAPVQREGMEYEFGLFAEIDPQHNLIVNKSRIPGLADAVISHAGEDLGQRIAAWLAGGESAQAATDRTPEAAMRAAVRTEPVLPAEVARSAVAETLLSTLWQIEDRDELIDWVCDVRTDVPEHERPQLQRVFAERCTALGYDAAARNELIDEAKLGTARSLADLGGAK